MGGYFTINARFEGGRHPAQAVYVLAPERGDLSAAACHALWKSARLTVSVRPMIRLHPPAPPALALALTVVAVLGGGVGAGGAGAQTVPPKLLSSHKDWDAFVRTDGGETQCYMVSRPKSTSPRGVRRGDVYLMVTHWPARGIRQEVSVITGYTYMADSEVTARIAKRSFKMFTSGDRAWLYDGTADGEMVAAMKRGARVVVEGLSSRNTRTTDRYSLIGFSAAYKAIVKACKGG